MPSGPPPGLPPSGMPAWVGYPPAQIPRTTRRLGHRRLITAMVGLVAVLAGALIGAALLVEKGVTPPGCPPTCPRPPTLPPVSADHSFTNARYGFTVDYYDVPGLSLQAQPTSDGLTLSYPNGSVVQFIATPASGQDAQQIVQSLVSRSIPGAQLAYQLPDPWVGYQAGFGAAYDVFQNSGGVAQRLRYIVLAAVKRNLAIIVAVSGPYQQFGDTLSDGHPSGADVLSALFADPSVNSVRWPGDPPR